MPPYPYLYEGSTRSPASRSGLREGDWPGRDVGNGCHSPSYLRRPGDTDSGPSVRRPAGGDDRVAEITTFVPTVAAFGLQPTL